MNCAIRADIYFTTEIIFFDESFYRIATKKNKTGICIRIIRKKNYFSYKNKNYFLWLILLSWRNRKKWYLHSNNLERTNYYFHKN